MKKIFLLLLGVFFTLTSFAEFVLEFDKPIVCAMEYEFPNEDFEQCKDQFMLGADYLVAPVVSPEFSRSVKLPKGKWLDDLGNVHEGGRTIKIDVPLDRLPYFKKL